MCLDQDKSKIESVHAVKECNIYVKTQLDYMKIQKKLSTLFGTWKKSYSEIRTIGYYIANFL